MTGLERLRLEYSSSDLLWEAMAETIEEIDEHDVFVATVRRKINEKIKEIGDGIYVSFDPKFYPPKSGNEL